MKIEHVSKGQISGMSKAKLRLVTQSNASSDYQRDVIKLAQERLSHLSGEPNKPKKGHVRGNK